MSPERTTTKAANGTSTNLAASAQKRTKASKPQGSEKKNIRRQPRTTSFQIRTTPEVRQRAEKFASQKDTGGRTKLDQEIYQRGLLLTMLIRGASPEGDYAGFSKEALAKELAPFFEQQYAILDSYNLLPPFVYRVVSPSGSGMTFMVNPATSGLTTNAETQQPINHTQENAYTLSQDADTALSAFPDEI